jgi:probable biosynthetic protein (TIGR04098 family)
MEEPLPFKLRDFIYNWASAFRSWRYRRAGMTIGTGCKISSSAKLDMTNPRGVVIGDNTAISFRTSILTHDFLNGRHVTTTVGSNSFIGAGSIILPGVQVGDNAVVGAGSVVFSDVPSNCVVTGNPARVVERNRVTGRWGTRKRDFLSSESISQLTTAEAAPVNNTSYGASDTATNRTDVLARYVPGLDPDTSFLDSGYDSFAMISLRAQIEQDEGIQIADSAWERVERPRDLLPYLPASTSEPRATVTSSAVSCSHSGQAVVSPSGPPAINRHSGHVHGAQARRHYEINMPQMSRKGLSESWLFKEIGDVHWTLITNALGMKSRFIADQDGDRLYATFTKIKYESNLPLSAFSENDEVDLSADMTRFGAGMFMSSIVLRSAQIQTVFQLMSSFSRFGEKGNNRSLTKGQPFIPEHFAIPSVTDRPLLSTEYAAIRASQIETPVYSTNYKIVPIHDINGVGLLYFAAYPIIHDICIERYVAGRFSLSPLARDVNYFANSGEGDELRFDISSWEEQDDLITSVAHISRGDGNKMATIRSSYKKA